MLPGFRILFAIVLLSVSVLVFGVGAAAFLRAAHDNLTSVPSWRPIETAYTPRIEPSQTETLSMMRVETAKDLGATSARIDQPASLSLTRPTEEPPIAVVDPVVTNPPAASADTLNADDLTTASVGAPSLEPAKPAAAIETSKPFADNAVSVAPESPAKPEALPEAADRSNDSPAKSAKADDNVVAPKEMAPAPAVPAKTGELAIAKPDQAKPAESAREPQNSPANASAATSQPDGATSPKPDQIAALQEPALSQQPSLPLSKVKIPKPRIDPIVIEAQRQELRIRQQRAAQVQAAARANARAKARRAAAVRAARVAAQTRATDPFGQPIQQAPTATR